MEQYVALLPQIAVIALQMMPDHLHGILFLKEKMEKDLSRVIRDLKTGCNRSYRELMLGPFVPSVATQLQQLQTTGQQPAAKPKEDRIHGLFFARGYNERLLLLVPGTITTNVSPFAATSACR